MVDDGSVESAVLGTVQVRIRLPSGELSAPLRGFCDPGSQVNLMTEHTVQALAIRRTKGSIQITGIGSTSSAAGFVKVSLFHRVKPEHVCNGKFLVVRNITRRLPDQRFDMPFDDALAMQELADDTLNVPGNIDILIGAGMWASIVRSGIIREQANEGFVVAQSTAFGWVVSGHAASCNHIRLLSCHIATDDQDARLDKLLLDFWKADSLAEEPSWTPNEQLAEDIFMSTHSRDHTGRYVVRIPLKRDHAALGISKNVAKARFLAVERKFARNPELFRQYKAVFDDYRAKRQMVLAPEIQSAKNNVYYLSHHAINSPVAGEDHIQKRGKFRVVFDPSVATSNGISFNDIQLVGPKMHDDLNEIFLRFRGNRFALTADIVQMLRQINIDPLDWNYQRVFWRDGPLEPLCEYIITCVTWGMTSAGFNAVRALRQCAIDGRMQYPIGAETVLKRFYCDDMMGGADDELGLARVYEQVQLLLAAGGFELNKWTTNNSRLAAHINQSKNAQVELSAESTVLGMIWKPDDDMLCAKIHPSVGEHSEKTLTKRIAISAMARVYDPNGLVAPVIVGNKILQQDLWRSGIGWDERVPDSVLPQWREFRQNIAALNSISMPRWICMGPGKQMQLHVFADASEKAMGAVAYLRTINENGEISICLITSRSKVSGIPYKVSHIQY